MNNFWGDLPKQFFCIAPMADVTDAAFREMFLRHGPPDVFWTEFVSADGLCSVGREHLLKDLWFGAEKPIVAQLFTGKKEKMYEAGMLAQELGFDGLDINMGCPDRSVEKQESGAAMIKDPKNAVNVIESAKRVGIPLSVKTRLGYNEIDYDWIKCCLSTGISALTIHARTRKEMSNVPAKWDTIQKVMELRDKYSPDTLIICNGDVTSIEHGEECMKISGANGVMVGRGIFGNPLFFNKQKNMEDLSIEERLTMMREHTKLFESKFENIKNIHIMKKHYKAYTLGIPAAQNLRISLMDSNTYEEIYNVIDAYIQK